MSDEEKLRKKKALLQALKANKFKYITKTMERLQIEIDELESR